MNWIKKVIFINIILILPIIFLITITEIILNKKMGLGQPVIYEPHTLWGYAPKPNYIYKRFDGDIITINNVGLRSIIEWKEEGEKILFLGDSITYGGSYINDNETFSSIVCKTLTNWQCFNGGVNGYGILNMVARSKYDHRIKNAEVVVFTFILEDFDRGLRNSNFAHFILREPPKILPATWEILNFASSFVKPKNWFGKKYKDNKTSEDIYKENAANKDFALEIFISEIERIKRNNKKVLIVYSPTIEELDKISQNNFSILKKLQKKFPNEYLSFLKDFKTAYENNEPKLYKDHVHYETNGHKLAAKILSKKLTTLILEN